ncbi:MAG: DUF3226 domain-containing protein [Flectobacillus sp.]|uniref:DUF3226 domain-containing protein n=1 Tax=Flectobacillus sp. TaxID=50419 RepID=UPI003B9D8C3A
MKKQFFVEGDADAKFLHDLIFYWYGINTSIGKQGNENSDILIIGGKENLLKLWGTIQRNSILDIYSIIIFDADIFVEESLKLESFKKQYPFQFFLLPDHHKNGDLESLLIQLIHPNHQIILDCWDTYETCLSSNNQYTLPARKTRIYAYMEALVGSSGKEKEKIKEAKRDYLNSFHWNLDAEILKPLKTFLDNYFIV